MAATPSQREQCGQPRPDWVPDEAVHGVPAEDVTTAASILVGMSGGASAAAGASAAGASTAAARGIATRGKAGARFFQDAC